MSGEPFGAMLRRLRLATLVQVPIKPGNWSSRLVTAPLSMNALAMGAGLDTAGVRSLEMGRTHPRRSTVMLLAEALDLNHPTTDRLLIAGGYWPWELDTEQTEAVIRQVRGAETETAPLSIGRRTG